MENVRVMRAMDYWCECEMNANTTNANIVSSCVRYTARNKTIYFQKLTKSRTHLCIHSYGSTNTRVHMSLVRSRQIKANQSHQFVVFACYVNILNLQSKSERKKQKHAPFFQGNKKGERNILIKKVFSFNFYYASLVCSIRNIFRFVNVSN